MARKTRAPPPARANRGFDPPAGTLARVTLRLFDSLTRELRDFVPVVPGKAGIYICGLTTQAPPHLGHVRFAVAFDVLRRWMTRGHGLDVTLIRNVTDIDDKILAKSAENGEAWYAVSYRNEIETAAALESLGVLPPTYEPRATGHVPEMVTLMEALVARGHAYAARDGSGDVYFDVRSWPAYGELTHQKVDDMADAEDADPRGKRDPRDFALWKGHKPEEPESASWPTPFGTGRPGWHLECSAMARKYLGDTFDIHGGGVDLRFPHHENEQAQSRAAGHPFASYWLHNAWITTSGEKMSKSLGNSLLIPAVLERVRGIELRYYIVAAHYRSHVEFSFEALDEAAAGFRRIENFLDRATALGIGHDERPTSTTRLGAPAEVSLPDAFVAAMDDDLGTPAAVAVLHNTVRDGNKLLTDGPSAALITAVRQVVEMLDVLGLDPRDPGWPTAGGSDARLTEAVDVLVQGLLTQRADARAAKDWARADQIRDQIKAAGIEVEDTPAGPVWTLPSTGGEKQ